MIRVVALLLFSVATIATQAQVVDYAREVVNTLASDKFKGRGYVDGGDKLAANFIKDEFKRFGLKSYSKDYFQDFPTSVNTFPDVVEVTINGNKLRAGVDFLVEAGSPSLKGSFDVISLTADELLDNEKFVTKLRVSSGNFLLIQPYDASFYSKEQVEQINGVINFLKFHPQNPSKGTIIITSDKLTWAGSTRKNPKPTLIIHADSVNKPITSLRLDLESVFIENYQTQNVLGYLEGENTDSTIVFMAHYDHLGKLGKDATFNGANDNASGMAMLLSLAEHYSKQKPEYTTVFIAFGAEELGLIGSKFFIDNPPFDLSTIKFFLNFDLAGTGDEGIQVVNGSVYLSKFDSLSAINQRNELLPEVRIRGAACNSDHCMFDQKEIQGFYIYTLGGIKAYHDIYDRPETLPLTEFEDYFKLITEFVRQL